MAANDGNGGAEMAAVGAAVIDLAAAMAPIGAEEVTLRHKGGGTIGVTIRYDLRPDYDYPTAEVGEGPEERGPGGDEPRASCICGWCMNCQRRGLHLDDLVREALPPGVGSMASALGTVAGGLAPRSGPMASAGVVH